MKYFNLAGKYEDFLCLCVSDRLWIHTNQRWHAPYHWAWKYGVCHFGFGWKPNLANPFELIAEGRAKVITEPQRIAIERFEIKVKAYYEADWDARLLRSIDSGIWQ